MQFLLFKDDDVVVCICFNYIKLSVMMSITSNKNCLLYILNQQSNLIQHEFGIVCTDFETFKNKKTE